MIGSAGRPLVSIRRTAASGTPRSSQASTEGSSNDGPDCVEIAIAPAATVHVRDSKDTQRAQLAFTGASWTEFVSSVRR
ncbi:DUF397 domain-containing protein [Streptomyces sp. NPDC059697]|uniref:DUF397 domain-containing protein n=1 Tax=Streptomyces sp. NPDC059697 TaxID=3346912 RepID=UPI00367F0A7B